jgi:hypothetical protein
MNCMGSFRSGLFLTNRFPRFPRFGAYNPRIYLDREGAWFGSFRSWSGRCVGSAVRLYTVCRPPHGNAFEPEKWLEKLPLAVYNLNVTRNLTLGVSPIEAERGYQPRQPLDLLPDIIKDMKLHPDLSARFEALQRLQCEIRESINLNNEKMKQKHDKRRRPFGTLKAGDLVWLNSQDVSVPAKQFLKTRKLTPRYFGP